jgi:RNA-directed DNA polymerase
MATTLRNVFERVCSFENLWLAYTRARRGKRYGEPAAWFDRRAENRILDLGVELREGRYWPGAYHHFWIREPKRRKISAAPFRDRVVHHAVINVLEPFYEARFSEASYACRRGKGTHAAMERAHWGVRNCRWLLKGDIVKFFPSVDHDILQAVLWRHVADRRLRILIERIVTSGRGVLEEERPPAWFPGDDLLSPAERHCGLPIGNLTSQFFANVLLNELDQFVHREIRPRLYVRYSDDFILFDHDKDKLTDARFRLADFAGGLRLRLHSRKTCLRPCRQGVVFLGFRLTPVTRRVSRDGISRFRRRMRGYRSRRGRGMRPDIGRITASVRGWLAHVEHANSRALVRRVLQDVVV